MYRRRLTSHAFQPLKQALRAARLLRLGHRVQSFGTQTDQQQNPSRAGSPAPESILQKFQGGAIRPLQIVHEQHQRRSLGQGQRKLHQRLEDLRLAGSRFQVGEFLGRRRQTRIAFAQFRQQLSQRGQPHSLQ